MGEETKTMRGLEAIRLAIEEEMERDESVFLIGEDIGRFGGAFFVTEGLLEKFGPERIRETPISENAILGCAVGAAMVGMRPIAEIMFADFLTVCMEMIVNQAAKARYIYGGQISVPVTIRVPFGTGIMGAAQHSQSFESWFMQVPGLKVVLPSDARDFKGLMKTAIRDDDPVIFFENKRAYYLTGEVPLDKDFTIPLGQARKFTEGDDVTIVATGAMVSESIKAARALETENIQCEVIDPRTLVPLDKEAILNSVEKTGRLLIVDEGCKTCSVSAEIAAIVAEEGFQFLKNRIIRLNTPDVPIPYSPNLEKAIIPNAKLIQGNVKKLI
ncbi:MAG: alpha-ketoacid dehydrogenase subunit beta [Candidatus Lokiarchaeota archaeon]|nr:alpha-ketoacid dehydrogenase subunit beta [Candidatus Lokiarchaeota archaeon]